MNKDGDLLTMPHPVSDRRLPMPRANRAAQFAPFAALTGYDAAVQEAGRRTEQRMELSEDAAEALNRKLCYVRDHLADEPKITATWFEPDTRKDGGTYRTASGRVKAWKPWRRCFVLHNGLAIPVDDLFELTVQN